MIDMPDRAPLRPTLAPTPDRSPRILIVRLSVIGDVISGVPVLCALRAALPDAYLGWVVEGHMGDLVDGHPALDTLIRVPRAWLLSPREIWQAHRRLRQLKFDVAIDLQCLTKNAVAAWLSGAPRRIGKSGPDGRELSRWFHNELVAPDGRHVIEHYLSMLRPLGIDAPAVHFDLPERAADARTANHFLRANGISLGRFVILKPGAGWPSKIWPAERYGALARRLGRAYAMPSVAVWGTPAERPLADNQFRQRS